MFVDKTENLCITLWENNNKIGGNNLKINSCETHINRALDEFVAKEETFPNMEPITNEEKLSTTCDYCDTLAVYLVTNT